MTDVEHEAEFVFTKDNPYLPFTGELWDVFYENLGKTYRVISAPHCLCLFTVMD